MRLQCHFALPSFETGRSTGSENWGDVFRPVVDAISLPVPLQRPKITGQTLGG